MADKFDAQEERCNRRFESIENNVKDVNSTINEIREVVVRLDEKQNSVLEAVHKVEKALNGNGKVGLITTVALQEQELEDLRKDLEKEEQNRKEELKEVASDWKSIFDKSFALYGILLSVILGSGVSIITTFLK